MWRWWVLGVGGLGLPWAAWLSGFDWFLTFVPVSQRPGHVRDGLAKLPLQRVTLLIGGVVSLQLLLLALYAAGGVLAFACPRCGLVQGGGVCWGRSHEVTELLLKELPFAILKYTFSLIRATPPITSFFSYYRAEDIL